MLAINTNIFLYRWENETCILNIEQIALAYQTAPTIIFALRAAQRRNQR